MIRTATSRIPPNEQPKAISQGWGSPSSDSGDSVVCGVGVGLTM